MDHPKSSDSNTTAENLDNLETSNKDDLSDDKKGDKKNGENKVSKKSKKASKKASKTKDKVLRETDSEAKNIEESLNKNNEGKDEVKIPDYILERVGQSGSTYPPYVTSSTDYHNIRKDEVEIPDYIADRVGQSGSTYPPYVTSSTDHHNIRNNYQSQHNSKPNKNPFINSGCPTSQTPIYNSEDCIKDGESNQHVIMASELDKTVGFVINKDELTTQIWNQTELLKFKNVFFGFETTKAKAKEYDDTNRHLSTASNLDNDPSIKLRGRMFDLTSSSKTISRIVPLTHCTISFYLWVTEDGSRGKVLIHAADRDTAKEGKGNKNKYKYQRKRKAIAISIQTNHGPQHSKVTPSTILILDQPSTIIEIPLEKDESGSLILKLHYSYLKEFTNPPDFSDVYSRNLELGVYPKLVRLGELIKKEIDTPSALPNQNKIKSEIIELARDTELNFTLPSFIKAIHMDNLNTLFQSHHQLKTFYTIIQLSLNEFDLAHLFKMGIHMSSLQMELIRCLDLIFTFKLNRDFPKLVESITYLMDVKLDLITTIKLKPYLAIIKQKFNIELPNLKPLISN